MSDMKLAFEMRRICLSLADILPARLIKGPQRNIKRFRTIRTSIKEAGMVEPLVVFPQKGMAGKYCGMSASDSALRRLKKFSSPSSLPTAVTMITSFASQSLAFLTMSFCFWLSRLKVLITLSALVWLFFLSASVSRSFRC